MLLDEPLAVIAAAVRADVAIADELLAESRRRIAERDPALGAVVAEVADPIRRGLDGPLAGVPYLLKDLQADAVDLPLTRGSRLLAGHPPGGDSMLVSRLRDAGAVILGRTNSPEFGLGIVTEPVLHGPTRNPWDPTRSAGGSSGGAAAAVAAGMVPAAHATDSGGSTRIPAAWCGVVGFKPSRGRNPAGPIRLDDWAGLSHEHAITRTVADSRTLLAVTARPAAGEWMPHPAIAPAPGRPLRIGVLSAGPHGADIDPDYAAALAECAAELERLGHDLVALPPVDAAAGIGPVFGTVVAAHLAELVSRVDAVSGARSLEPAVGELAERGATLGAVEFVAAVHDLHRIARSIADAFRGVDVVVSPTTAWGPPAVGALSTSSPASELFAEIFRLSPFAAMFNVTGGPGLSLPWGADRTGIPIGIHLGAAPGADEAVLGVAQALESARPERVRLTPPRPGR